MGPMFKFLNSLRSLAKTKNMTIKDAYKFAEQEFGEVSDLLKLQINKIFKDVEAPKITLPKKDEVFDTTVTKLPYDESGRPFNPRDPLKKYGDDPEEFATGGRVGYSDGGYTFEQFLKDKQQVDEFMSIEELKREYKRMMELKKIRDQRDMVATGGRVGFDDGGILSLEEAKKLNPGMFVDTTTYNPIPENAPNMAADEIAKVIMGTGFLREEDDELGYPEGMEKPMSSREFIFKSYVVPKRKELMENFGLTMKEADDLIREGMAKYRTNKAIGGRVGFQKGTSKIFDQLEMDVPYPYGHRVNYQIGGPAYDATDPIYGSSAITVTPDTIMGLGGNQIQAQMGKPSMTSQFFSGPAFDEYSAERTRAYTQSPSRLQYNLDANKAAGQFIQDRSKEMFGDNFLGKGLGILGTAASVPLAAAISPFHEAAQVIAEGRMEPGSGAKGFYDAFMAEKPFLTAAQRAGGVLQSIPVVGDAVTKAGEGIYDLLNKPTTTQPTYDSKSAGAIITDGDSKYKVNADGSRTLIGKLGEATPTQDDYYAQNESAIRSGMMPAQKPTMADVAGPGTSNNLLSLFERYKNIQTPISADPINHPGFKGETALGNIEKGIKNFLGSNKGLKYGKDIPSDINDIYSFIEGERRSFSPDLSQNYYGGDLYNYLQDFYTYKYGDPRIDNFGFSGREDVFKSYFNKPYKFGLASGGRVGFAVGSLPKGIQALVKQINKKFGKGAMKTADEIDQPPKTDQQIISEFEARNPSPSRQLTDDEIDELAAEVGELDAYDFDGTVGSANRIRKEAKDYQDEMYQQYKMGKLDPEPGDKSQARKMFLEKKLEEMLLSDDPKLMTKDEIEELTFFDMGTEIDQMRKSKPKSIIPENELAQVKKDFDTEILGKEIEEGVDDVMRDTSPAGLEKSLEVDDLMLKYPGMSRDLAKQIANDPDPKRKADVISMIEQTFKMDEMGMSGDEIIDIFRKKTDRTKQAGGGLSYLSGF